MTKRKNEWTEWVDVTDHRAPPHTHTWLNSRYQVTAADLPTGVTYLSIKRLSKAAIHDWRELYRIKNELTHPEREGIELYPSSLRVQDTVNQYHMFVMPAGVIVNLGYLTEAAVRDDAEDRYQFNKPRQRPLPKWMEPTETHSNDMSVTAKMLDGARLDEAQELDLVIDTRKEEEK